MSGAKCSIGDHDMIKSTTKLFVRQRMRKDKMPIKKFATNTIEINRVRADLQAFLNNRLAEISAVTVEEKWNAFKSFSRKIAKDKLGILVRKHEDWFDGNSMKLEKLINRTLARNNMLSNNTKPAKDRYRTCCQLLQQRFRELKNKWWPTKAGEIQILLDSNELQGFFYESRRTSRNLNVNHARTNATSNLRNNHR